MYERDTILALTTPKWRPVVDGEPGDWTAEGFEAFNKDYQEYHKQLVIHQADPRKKAPEPLDGEPFPYNEVRVIGPSPVDHGSTGDWTGSDSNGVIIEPRSGFAANGDFPFGYIRSIYTVVSVPEPLVLNPMATRNPLSNAQITQIPSQGQTPEDVFRAQAPGVAPEEGQTRGRTPIDELIEKPADKVFDPLGAKS